MNQVVAAVLVGASVLAASCGGADRRATPPASVTTARPERCLYDDGRCSGADLAGVDLSDDYLERVDFSGADLSNANLSGTEAKGAIFAGANLRGANLRRTGLEFADFTGADLTNADLTEARPVEASFRDAKLVGTNLSETSVDRADFTDALFDGVTIAPGSHFLYAIGFTLESLAAALGTTPDALLQTIIDRQLQFVSPGSMTPDLEPACSGTPVPTARPAVPNAAFHPTSTVLVAPASNQDHGRPHSGYDTGGYEQPREWNAPALPLTEYVACVHTQPVDIDRCHYRTGGFQGRSVTLTRWRQDVTVRIVEAATAAVLAERSFSGGEPAECRSDIGVPAGSSGVVERGSWPAEQVRAFVAEHVGTPPPGMVTED